MTASEGAFGSAAPGARPPRWTVLACAAAMAVLGLTTAVYLFAGEGTYRDLMAARAPVTFLLPEGTLAADETMLVGFHAETLDYVLGAGHDPARLADGRPLFDDAERAHLADVRGLFGGVRIAWIAGALLFLALALGARPSGYLVRMLRDGALYAGAATLAVALVVALAFPPLFLAFHYLFFPQGNFLFDPATSNLIRLYPETYWYGVTLRVGLGVVGVSAAVAAGLTLVLRAVRS